jgi:hypothetical protein
VVVDKLVVEIVGGATDVVGVKDVNRVDDNDDDDDEDEVDDVVEVSTGAGAEEVIVLAVGLAEDDDELGVEAEVEEVVGVGVGDDDVVVVNVGIDDDDVGEIMAIAVVLVELDIVNRSNTSFPAYFVKFSWYFMIRPAAAILLEK